MRARITDPGTVTRITGTMGTGKTDFSLFIAEQGICKRKDPDYRILTNIVMDWDMDPEHPLRDQVIEVTSLPRLYWEITRTKQGVLILDEAGIYASTGASSKRSEIGQWEQIIKLIRKFGLGIIWIDQRGKGSTPPTVRALCRYHVHKPYKTRAEFYEVYYDQRGDKERERKLATWKVSKESTTSLPFDTNAPGSFNMVLGVRTEVKDNGKSKDIPLTSRDVFDYLANVKGREIRPKLQAWLRYHNITDKTPQASLLEKELPSKVDLDNKGEDLEDEGVRIPSATEAIFLVLDKAQEKGRDPPKNKILADIFDIHPVSVSRIRGQWREERMVQGEEILEAKGSSPSQREDQGLF